MIKKDLLFGCSVGMGFRFDKLRLEISGNYTGKQKWKYISLSSKEDKLPKIDGFFWSMNLYYDLVNIGKASIYAGAGIGAHKFNYSY